MRVVFFSDYKWGEGPATVHKEALCCSGEYARVREVSQSPSGLRLAICTKALEAKVAETPLGFLFSILTCSSTWQRHRPRFTHWETIGVGWIWKGVLWSRGAASPGHLPPVSLAR